MRMENMPQFEPDSWQHKLLNKYYYGRENWRDGSTQFHHLIERFVEPGSRILELGAGASNSTTEFLSSLGTVVGLDIDSDVKSNRYCAEARIYDGLSIPFISNIR